MKDIDDDRVEGSESSDLEMADDDAVLRYAELATQKQEAERHLNSIKEEMKALEERVLRYFQNKGIDRVAANGRTVYIKRELWAGRDEGADADEIGAALLEAGLGEYFPNRVNWQSLSAFCRELDASGESLPEPLVGKVKVTEQFKVGTRSS